MKGSDLVNSFQESILSKEKQKLEDQWTSKMRNEAIQTAYCNQMLDKIIEVLRTKKGLDGNVCTFSLRSLHFDYDSYGYNKHLETLLNECFKAHHDLKHFKITYVEIPYNACPTDCFGPECDTVLTCFCCCFCWYPCYCIPVNIVDMILGKKITYKVTLKLVSDSDTNIPIGVPWITNPKNQIQSMTSESSLPI